MSGLHLAVTDGLAPACARLVVVLPAVAAGAGLALARRPLTAARVAVTGAVLMLLAAVGQLVAVHAFAAAPVVTTMPALPLGDLQLPLHLQSDQLSAIVALAVAVVGCAVQFFSRWYLRLDDRYGVFASTVSLFLAGMLLVVQSGDLVLILVGWEVMGWCSYLLIGHDSRREAARRAAFKAFLVVRVGDLAFVIGLIILAVGARSTDIAAVLRYWTGGTAGVAAGAAAPSTAMLTAAVICLLSGIAGKSAQFPFHDWLPDAMEGPTPASALIHAATMVAAGTYVVARLFDLFAASDAARLVLAAITAVTMVGGAVLAFGQSDLKRLLAYSTISQIAIMLSAMAVVSRADGPDAGIVHLLTHAMFKALLFLGIGWLSVLVGGTAAVVMRGGVRMHPELARPIGIGLLALAGVPPLAGFVSKEYVLAAAEDSANHGVAVTGWVVLVALAVTVPLTAAYCMRAWLVLTHLHEDEEEAADIAAGKHIEDVTLADLLVEHRRAVAAVHTQPLTVRPAPGAGGTSPTVPIEVGTQGQSGPHEAPPGPVHEPPLGPVQEKPPTTEQPTTFEQPTPPGLPVPPEQAAAPEQPTLPAHGVLPEQAVLSGPGGLPGQATAPLVLSEEDEWVDEHQSITDGARRWVAVLGLLSVVGGAVVFTPLVRLGASPDLVVAGGSLVLMLLAAVAVRLMRPRTGTGDAADRLGPRTVAAFDAGLRADGLYVAAVARPVTRLARLVVAADRDVIDAYVRASAVTTRLAGRGGERAHTGNSSAALVWVLLGVLAVGVTGVALW